MAEPLARQHELAEAQHHADDRQGKPPAPAEARGGERHQERAEQRTDADADIEDRETRIPARTSFRIELGHHDADVGLQEAHAEHDDHESQKERLNMAEDEQRVAAHDEDAADDHGALRPEQAVRHPAAEEREDVGRGDIETVDRAGYVIVEPEAAVAHGGDRVENQNCAHPVIREALPHLREKQRHQPARLTKHLVMYWVGVRHMKSRAIATSQFRSATTSPLSRAVKAAER